MLKKIGLVLAGGLLLAGCGTAVTPTTTSVPDTTSLPTSETYSWPTSSDPVTTSESTPETTAQPASPVAGTTVPQPRAAVPNAPKTQSAPKTTAPKTAAPKTTAPAVTHEAECSGDYYRNSSGNCVHRPSDNPSGATALCKDGSYSYSQHRSGTCSGHGGVRTWL